MKVQLKNCILSFPNLFKPKAFAPGDDPKFGATLLIKPGSTEEADMRKAISEVTTLQWPKGMKLTPDKICLRDGADKSEYDGFEGNLYVSSRGPVRPGLFDKDGSPVEVDDGLFYAGCTVQAIVDVWAQDNKFGKRINATLSGVKFKAQGTPLSGTKPAAASDFEDTDDEADPLA